MNDPIAASTLMPRCSGISGTSGTSSTSSSSTRRSRLLPDISHDTHPAIPFPHFEISANVKASLDGHPLVCTAVINNSGIHLTSHEACRVSATLWLPAEHRIDIETRRVWWSELVDSGYMLDIVLDNDHSLLRLYTTDVGDANALAFLREAAALLGVSLELLQQYDDGYD
ncbi:hypothetical protein BC831DRAFT_511609 [Entophlyctis helioformis]|nr:hypothetical protein BC831DRAFT_511609 [Entophlyctis helioformis]